jgi:rsbT co-antagonist protein RsbR
MASNYAIEILKSNEADILKDWLLNLQGSGWGEGGRFSQGTDWQGQAKEFLHLIGNSARGDTLDIDSPQATPLREFLQNLSRTLALRGATSSQTATFVFSLKKPIFSRLRTAHGNDAQKLADDIWSTTEMIDKMGMYTVATYQQTREDIIARQQEEMLELSTPVVKLWDGVLALPMIGTLDSSRTQIVMESLLQRIVETGSELAIIDITGVPTVDTLVAQHLLKTVTAIRLMGADAIISGIRPQIAQTIVHLGIDLQGITTKATLADALALAMKRGGFTVGKARTAAANGG